MARQGKPRKVKTEARRPLAGKPAEDPAGKVRDLEKLLAEALEQQVAASEILRVLSSSPNHVQPVVETVVESAVRLCEAERAFIFRLDGEFLRIAAAHNTSPEVQRFGRGHRVDLDRPGRDRSAMLSAGGLPHVRDVRATTRALRCHRRRRGDLRDVPASPPPRAPPVRARVRGGRRGGRHLVLEPLSGRAASSRTSSG